MTAALGSWIGNQVDRKDRLHIVRQSIIWQRLSVAASCLILVFLLSGESQKGPLSYGLFSISVVLACFEKLAFTANSVSVERDWVIVVSDSLQINRQELNSVMRRIDLVCKLLAPVGVGVLDGYSTKVAIWIVFVQNAISVSIEYFAIAHVYDAIPELAHSQKDHTNSNVGRPETRNTISAPQTLSPDVSGANPSDSQSALKSFLHPWLEYFHNPAFLASFSLSILYLTVLSFASQMTTFLLNIGYTSVHVSIMRLVSVFLELSATCAAPWLMSKIGAIRAGLWFINEQLLAIAVAIGLFFNFSSQPKLAGGALVLGVCLSRLGLWGFDLSVQFLVQEDAPEATRGSFSAIEMSLQNLFEVVSFAMTMVFNQPEQFKVPICLSGCAVAISAACFAGFVRQKRGHLLHTDKCLRRMGRKARYQVLPTIEEEVEMDENESNDAGRK